LNLLEQIDRVAARALGEVQAVEPLARAQPLSPLGARSLEDRVIDPRHRVAAVAAAEPPHDDVGVRHIPELGLAILLLARPELHASLLLMEEYGRPVMVRPAVVGADVADRRRVFGLAPGVLVVAVFVPDSPSQKPDRDADGGDQQSGRDGLEHGRDTRAGRW